MLNKTLDILSTRAATTLATILMTIALTGASVMFTLGKAAIEDNTTASNSLETTVNLLSADVKVVKTMADELREYSFNDQLGNLSKQAFKLDKDPDDIKPSDMIAASDFCASNLFDDYIEFLAGSKFIKVAEACNDANGWLRQHDTDT